jgi:hypothetical protein
MAAIPTVGRNLSVGIRPHIHRGVAVMVWSDWVGSGHWLTASPAKICLRDAREKPPRTRPHLVALRLCAETYSSLDPLSSASPAIISPFMSRRARQLFWC